MVYYKKLESISKLVTNLVQNILKNTIMWKKFYIKPNEIGILYHRSDFKKILQPGHTLILVFIGKSQLTTST